MAMPLLPGTHLLAVVRCCLGAGLAAFCGCTSEAPICPFDPVRAEEAWDFLCQGGQEATVPHSLGFCA